MNQTTMKLVLATMAAMFVISNFRDNSLVKIISG